MSLDEKAARVGQPISANTGAPATPGLTNWRQSRRNQALVGGILRYALLLVLSVVFLMPLIWMVSTSLKTDFEILLFPPTWIPQKIMWSNYVELVESYDLLLYTRNSAFVSAIVIVGNLLSSAFIAYGFARLRARGSNVLFALVLATMMLPGQVTMVPLYLLFRAFGWLDTFLPLVVPPFFGNAFLIFMLRQFFRTIPRDFSEAARIDGCSEFRIFGQIILPLSVPALTTVAIFSFIWAWNDFLGPLLYLSRREQQTLALAIAKLQEMPAFAFSRFNYAMGLAFVSLLPCIVVFFVAQQYYIEGIVTGGIKG